MAPPRLFTLEEANALIPRLELIMERLTRHAATLRVGLETVAREQGCAVAEIDTRAILAERPDLRQATQEIEELVGAIEASGAQFKGLELGLVDFPAEVEGRGALLCWQYGEKEITHWHAADAGFGARQPLNAAARRPVLQ